MCQRWTEIKVTKGYAVFETPGADKIPDQTPLTLTQSCSGHGEFSPSKLLLYCSDTMEGSFKGVFRKVFWPFHHVKSRAAGSPSSPMLSTVLQWAAQPLGVTACTQVFPVHGFKKANSLLSILPCASVCQLSQSHSSTSFLLLLLQSITLDMTNFHTGFHCVLYSLILTKTSV